MKNRNLLACIWFALVSSIFLGCASAPVGDSDMQLRGVSKNASSKHDDFDDWKYKGFGLPLPAWVQPAIEGKTEKVAKSFPSYTSDELEIFMASGMNVDQSESKLKSQIPQGKKLIDGFWVRLNIEEKKTSEPYITVLIYEKNMPYEAQEDME